MLQRASQKVFKKHSRVAVWKLYTSPHMINLSAVCKYIYDQLLATKVGVWE